MDVLDFQLDRLRSEFGRHTAPLIRVAEPFESGETAVIVSGLLPNRRAQPLVHHWYAARFHGDAGATLRQRWVVPEVSITRDTGYPEWDGEPLDYDWALGCLLPAKKKTGTPRRQRSRPAFLPGTAPDVTRSPVP